MELVGADAHSIQQRLLRQCGSLSTECACVNIRAHSQRRVHQLQLPARADSSFGRQVGNIEAHQLPFECVVHCPTRAIT